VGPWLCIIPHLLSPAFLIRTHVGSRLGSDPNGERKRLNKIARALTTCLLDEKPTPAPNIYVLLRSFEAREMHLRELDAFRAELPGSQEERNSFPFFEARTAQHIRHLENIIIMRSLYKN
jgi:hypothetical protein